MVRQLSKTFVTLHLSTLIMLAAIHQGCISGTQQATAFQADTPTSSGLVIETKVATVTASATPSPPANPRLDWIVYSGTKDGLFDLFLLSPDGDETIPMGLTSLSPISPSWSPDRQRIVFSTSIIGQTTNSAPRDIYLVYPGCVDLPEGCLAHAHNLTADDDSGLFQSPTWSPDGSQIAYDYHYESGGFSDPAYIFIMNADGTHRRKLSRIDGLGPDWSPDGQWIAYTNDTLPSHGSCRGCGNIYIVSVDGSELYEFPIELGDSASPAWSPDGLKLAFSSYAGNDPLSSSPYVYIANIDGTGVRRVTDFPGSSPTWSSDGSRLVFMRCCEGLTLFMINIDGTDGKQLTNDEFDPGFPAWWSP